jgi:hypothetical protein
MVYVAALFALILIATFSLLLHRASGNVLFVWYRALGLASDRERFVRGYTLFIRTICTLMACLIIAGLLLRVAE